MEPDPRLIELAADLGYRNPAACRWFREVVTDELQWTQFYRCPADPERHPRVIVTGIVWGDGRSLNWLGQCSVCDAVVLATPPE